MDLWSLGRLEMDEGEGKSLVGEIERARSGRETAATSQHENNYYKEICTFNNTPSTS